MSEFSIPVIEETSEYIVINKPHGLRVVEDRYDASLPTVKDIMTEQTGGRIWIAHRLDAGTGGVLVLAKAAGMHKRLNSAFEAGRAEKTYIAVVQGGMEEAVIDLPISKKVMRGRYRINFSSGRPSITNFFPLAVSDKGSIVKAVPETGRTHQIRVHLKAAGHPLAIDRIYGETVDEDRLTLFAETLTLTLDDGRRFSWTAPMSEFMRKAMQELGFGHFYP